jgi:peptidoglycan/LPS O-acetylase OafA/YrhL
VRSVRWLAWLAAAIIALSLWHVADQRGDVVVLPLRTTLLAVLFGTFIYLVSQFPHLRRTRAIVRAPWLRTLGKYSYGLYVYHGLVAYALVRYPPERFLVDTLGSHLAASFVQVGVGVGISMAVSIASYEWFEVYFIRLKDRFAFTPNRRPSVASAAPAQVSSPAVAARIQTAPAIRNY